jgi:hypothetical protein
MSPELGYVTSLFLQRSGPVGDESDGSDLLILGVLINQKSFAIARNIERLRVCLE